jgi:hypothetical protein
VPPAPSPFAALALEVGGAAPPPTNSPPTPPPVVLPPPEMAGPMPFRRLTLAEYRNTVRDLLGIDAATVMKDLSPDVQVGEVPFGRGSTISGSEAGELMRVSAALAASIPSRLADVLPSCCLPLPKTEAGLDACARQFITQFGKRAFRRPLPAAEVEALFKLYASQRSPEPGGDFGDAIRVLVEAMLQSPGFLYRWELGTSMPIKDGRAIRLNAYEIASRLSYLFWASMPDEALFQAADANKLYRSDEIEAQARRLAASPRARDGIEDFHLSWLDLRDLPEAMRASPFTPTLARQMLNETMEFAARLYAPGGDGRVQTLLTSSTTFVEPELARLYGVTLAPDAGLTPVSLDPRQRSGLFTQASFLTAKGGGDGRVARRGSWLLANLLCTEIPVPPVNVPDPPPPLPGQTTRDRLAAHAAQPCAVCHTIIDPPGFALESYDDIGAYRTMEAGKAIDTSGSVDVDGNPITFHDATELFKILAQRPSVQDCLTVQWFRYNVRRRETSDETGTLRQLREVLSKSGDLRELRFALTRSSAFVHRSPAPGEVLP